MTKAPAPINDAPASAYVSTHDESMRSGAFTLPEILRQAPSQTLRIANILG